MFTGIVQSLGQITGCQPTPSGMRLTIQTSKEILSKIQLGDSLSVNGVCLTATAKGQDHLEFDVVRETLDRTTLGRLKVGGQVNLERALTLQSTLDGHLVQGHVDGVATISKVQPSGEDARLFSFECSPTLLRYIVEKGSVAVDGVSLTVVQVGETTFSVALIPHTLQVTTMGSKQAGDPVNIEVDILAKYAEKWLGAHLGGSPCK